jgi:hypothetical protein
LVEGITLLFIPTIQADNALEQAQPNTKKQEEKLQIILKKKKVITSRSFIQSLSMQAMKTGPRGPPSVQMLLVAHQPHIGSLAQPSQLVCSLQGSAVPEIMAKVKRMV